MWQGARRKGFEQDKLMYDEGVRDIIAYLDDLLQNPSIKEETRIGIRFVMSLLRTGNTPTCETPLCPSCAGLMEQEPSMTVNGQALENWSCPKGCGNWWPKGG